MQCLSEMSLKLCLHENVYQKLMTTNKNQNNGKRDIRKVRQFTKTNIKIRIHRFKLTYFSYVSFTIVLV